MSAIQKGPSAVGPRIYNLFPLLVGPVDRWGAHLERVAGMGFNWIYVNPFHYSGFSGSLYAIKDPYRLHDLLTGDPAEPDATLRRFLDAASGLGLRVMMDLVVNHTALDALLVDQHPEWYRRDASGELYRPRAIDPLDPTIVTEWGDLAELDYADPATRDGLVGYWSDYIRHYLGLGVSGFRCDAAYKVPAEVWRRLISAARSVKPDAVFFAENLGASLPELDALHDAGFDYLFNSSKWWDFRDDWLLDQYERYRRVAPSIAFPESHDTSRVAAELGTNDPDRIAREAKYRYLFAACFSSGVMMPIGYEYGFRKRLDVVTTRPDDWEDAGIDISDFIAATNRMKAAIPVLNQEGPQRRLSSPDGPALALMREALDRSDGCALLLLNPDRSRANTVDPGRLLAETGGLYRAFEDATPLASPLRFDRDTPMVLEPLEMRIFRGERELSRPAGLGARGEKTAIRKIQELASRRLTIEEVWPEIDGGRHPIKRVVGDRLEVWADIFCDGHDVIAACIKYKEAAEREWSEAPMVPFDNDRWVGRFLLRRNTRYLYTIEAWRDLFASWRAGFVKKRAAGQTLGLDLSEGRALVERAADGATERDAQSLRGHLERLTHAQQDETAQAEALLSDALRELMARAAPRTNLTRYDRDLDVVVDRLAGRYGAWYELFPRSMSGDPSRHGTFDDVIARLPYLREMGVDVLYLPPIHPIGQTNRKGRNNTLQPAANDPGSPYAIGSPEGGHTAIHHELGDFAAFHRLVEAAREQGLEIALDFAIQCSPDHPWLKEHPEWFDWRPDGTIRFAENPPKRYEDIVNVHFYRDALPGIWLALRDVVLFWIEHGVTIFRVDNPHTKPVPFWEWMIRAVQERYPETVFLSEAFTRPKVMRKLAKVGFTQSYTYFTWRNTKSELTEYLAELSQTPCREYLRPNFFVNTPDINPPFLQQGGRAAFIIRAVLAGTLSSLWGMYSGFELCEATPIPGREEYLDSEKYQMTAWDWDRPGNIRDVISRLNRIRRDNPALHDWWNLRFHIAHDDHILFYGKSTADHDNIVWVAVNLDPYAARETVIELPMHELGLGYDAVVDAEELLGGERLRWHGQRQTVQLDPLVNPCMIWRVIPLVR
jgi:starch synthase (maltosyl-transferring)